MGMQPIPRPPLGHNPRRPQEKDLDDATDRDHRSREVAGGPAGGPIGRILRTLFSRAHRRR
jgi:hypothetical protein